MVIYGEYLFLENFVTGLVILYFTGKAAGAALRAGRLLLGGFCCGLYSFILFINVYGVLALAGKLAFAAAVVCLVFGRMPRRRFLACTGLFLLVTFLYGGTATAPALCFWLAGSGLVRRRLFSRFHLSDGDGLRIGCGFAFAAFFCI